MTPTEKESINQLVNDFGDACFNCGEWQLDVNDDRPPYEEIYAIQQTARNALIDAFEARYSVQHVGECALRFILGSEFRLTAEDLTRIVNYAGAANDLSWCVKDLMLAHYINAGLRNALEKLVRVNEEWNAAVETVIGKPVGWNTEYLDEAKRLLGEP